MKVGDLVGLRERYKVITFTQPYPPESGIVVGVIPACQWGDVYIKLHNLQVKVLANYYEVISESR